MVEALTLEKLKKKAKEMQENGESKGVIGIMLARYDIPFVREMIDQNYSFWHKNTGKKLFVFWAGYGAYLDPSKQNDYKKILNFNHNRHNAYYDEDAFITIKNELKYHLPGRFKDRMQLFLLDFHSGEVQFNKNIIQIDFKSDENLIRDTMELITDICSSATDISTLSQKRAWKNIHDFVSEITLFDIAKGLSIIL